MSDTILALVLSVVLIVAMFVLLPLLQSLESLSRRYSMQRSEEIPDLRDDDASPQFTGEIA